MINKNNWEETKVKWTNYWKHQNTGRPLMAVFARKPEIEQYANGQPGTSDNYLHPICQGQYYNLPEELRWTDMDDKYLNAERMVARYRYFCETHEFMGESFPNLCVDLGPGSLAAYLGSDIGFNESTVWFTETYEDVESLPELKFNPENSWWKRHLALVQECRRLAGDDFLVDMPDLMENVDVLASLCGSSNVLTDMLMEPELVEARIADVTNAYYSYYDRLHEEICDENGGNAYTVFQIWGPGKTTKLQCDLSAMFSADTFREFIQEPLRQQAKKADQVLYHLDGAEAIRHLDALMEIDEIDALQWTSGDIKPDGTFEQWDEIYDKVIAAGKSLWVKVYTGSFDDWIQNCDRIVKKYGSHSLFFLFPEMSHEQATYLLDYAEKNWSNIKGTYCQSIGK